MAVTNKKIDQLQKEIAEVQGRRLTLRSELAALKTEQANMTTEDLGQAVARHTQLAAEIAGRESVVKTLTARESVLAEDLAGEVKRAKEVERLRLRAEIDAYFRDVEQQVAAVHGLVTSPDLDRMVAELESVADTFEGASVRNRVHSVSSALANLLLPSYFERNGEWVKRS